MPEDKGDEKKPELQADAKDATTVAVKVYSPFKVYFEGMATSVSAESRTGSFDILPLHHNFITLLVPCDLIVRTEKGDETFPIAGGVMHVKANLITVFLDI